MASTQSPLLRKYNALRAAKRLNCAGKKTNADVKKAAATYVKAAVAKGQTKAEAEKKARAVMRAGCKMSSVVAGSKRKTTARKTTKRKTTARR